MRRTALKNAPNSGKQSGSEKSSTAPWWKWTRKEETQLSKRLALFRISNALWTCMTYLVSSQPRYWTIYVEWRVSQNSSPARLFPKLKRPFLRREVLQHNKFAWIRSLCHHVTLKIGKPDATQKTRLLEIQQLFIRRLWICTLTNLQKSPCFGEYFFKRIVRFTQILEFSCPIEVKKNALKSPPFWLTAVFQGSRVWWLLWCHFGNPTICISRYFAQFTCYCCHSWLFFTKPGEIGPSLVIWWRKSEIPQIWWNITLCKYNYITNYIYIYIYIYIFYIFMTIKFPTIPSFIFDLWVYTSVTTPSTQLY